MYEPPPWPHIWETDGDTREQSHHQQLYIIDAFPLQSPTDVTQIVKQMFQQWTRKLANFETIRCRQNLFHSRVLIRSFTLIYPLALQGCWLLIQNQDIPVTWYDYTSAEPDDIQCTVDALWPQWRQYDTIKQIQSYTVQLICFTNSNPPCDQQYSQYETQLPGHQFKELWHHFITGSDTQNVSFLVYRGPPGDIRWDYDQRCSG